MKDLHSPKYFYQDSDQTLQEALDEYYRCNPDFEINGGFLGQDAHMIQGHDVIHALYGLGTTSTDELLVETATAIGCKTSFKEMKTFKPIQFASSLLKIFGPYRLIKRFVLTTPKIIRMTMRCIRQSKRWDHGGYQIYMETSLSRIREQYNIEVWSKEALNAIKSSRKKSFVIHE